MKPKREIVRRWPFEGTPSLRGRGVSEEGETRRKGGENPRLLLYKSADRLGLGWQENYRGGTMEKKRRSGGSEMRGEA